MKNTGEYEVRVRTMAETGIDVSWSVEAFVAHVEAYPVYLNNSLGISSGRVPPTFIRVTRRRGNLTAENTEPPVREIRLRKSRG